jgi:hypothetical protein
MQATPARTKELPQDTMRLATQTQHSTSNSGEHHNAAHNSIIRQGSTKRQNQTDQLGEQPTCGPKDRQRQTKTEPKPTTKQAHEPHRERRICPSLATEQGSGTELKHSRHQTGSEQAPPKEIKKLLRG